MRERTRSRANYVWGEESEKDRRGHASCICEEIVIRVFALQRAHAVNFTSEKRDASSSIDFGTIFNRRLRTRTGSSPAFLGVPVSRTFSIIDGSRECVFVASSSFPPCIFLSFYSPREHQTNTNVISGERPRRKLLRTNERTDATRSLRLG